MKSYLTLMLLLAIAFQPAVLLAEDVKPAVPTDAAAVIDEKADEAKDELTEGEDWDLGLEEQAEDKAEKVAEDVNLDAPVKDEAVPAAPVAAQN